MSETNELHAPQFLISQVTEDVDKRIDSNYEPSYEEDKENEPSSPLNTDAEEPSHENAEPLNEMLIQPLQKLTKRCHDVLQSLDVPHDSKKPILNVDELPKFVARPAAAVCRTIPKRSAAEGASRADSVPKVTPYHPPLHLPTMTKNNELKEEEVFGFGVPLPKNSFSKKTQIKPFSFEQRDREMLEKKKKKIEKIHEEEKKLREFKAKPVPVFVATSKASRVNSKQPS